LLSKSPEKLIKNKKNLFPTLRNLCFHYTDFYGTISNSRNLIEIGKHMRIGDSSIDVLKASTHFTFQAFTELILVYMEAQRTYISQEVWKLGYKFIYAA
jgi:hypothetical protein